MWGNPGGWRLAARTRRSPQEINSSEPACLLAPMREVQDVPCNLQRSFSLHAANPLFSASNLMSGL